MAGRLFAINLVLLLTSICFFLAAFQLTHLGEGAPDWHTVKRPQIPVESSTEDSVPPGSPPPELSGSSVHPPIAVVVAFQVSSSEPVYGFKYDPSSRKWVRACLGKHAVCRYVRKLVTAYWIETLHCYGFYDDYGRLRLLPDFR